MKKLNLPALLIAIAILTMLFGYLIVDAIGCKVPMVICIVAFVIWFGTGEIEETQYIVKSTDKIVVTLPSGMAISSNSVVEQNGTRITINFVRQA